MKNFGIDTNSQVNIGSYLWIQFDQTYIEKIMTNIAQSKHVNFVNKYPCGSPETFPGFMCKYCALRNHFPTSAKLCDFFYPISDLKKYRIKIISFKKLIPYITETSKTRTWARPDMSGFHCVKRFKKESKFPDANKENPLSDKHVQCF